MHFDIDRYYGYQMHRDKNSTDQAKKISKVYGQILQIHCRAVECYIVYGFDQNNSVIGSEVSR